MNCHFLFQGVFLTQGLNLGLLHCRQILYCISHQGSPSSHMAVLNISFPISSVQFSHSVMSDSVIPWTVAHQATLSITNSWSLLRLMSTELVMPPNHLLCRPLLLPSVFPSIRVFSNESVLMRWPKCYSFSISLSNEYSGQIFFRID